MDSSREVAVVTGASGEIGHAIATSLLERFEVVGLDRAPSDRTRTVELSDRRAVIEAFAAIDAPVRHLVLAAGGSQPEELELTDFVDSTDELIEATFRDNVLACWIPILVAVPLMRAVEGDRSITIIGSANARGGWRAPIYSSAKGSIEGICRGLAPALGRDGIRINVLAPGTTDTPAMRSQLRDAAGGPDAALERIANRSALHRILQPSDIAGAVASLVSMAGLTGQVIDLENGQLLWRGQ